MKKALILVLSTLYFCSEAAFSFSQSCPACSIALSCDSVPAAPKICPSSFPTDTAGQYYNADLTFYVPKQIQDPVYGTVDINKIEVLGVTNLPPGMTWTAYNHTGAATNSFYPPSSPPQSERGCAKVCGTPPLPFDDSIYVNVLAYVTALGTNTTQNSTFGVHLKIVPNTSGNSSFTVNNPGGCGTVTTTFTSLYPSNGNPGYHYQWNFGNNLMSAAENPPAQTYSSPGTYNVLLQTTIDTFKFYLKSVTVNAVGCNDNSISAPDLYLKIFDGNNNLVLQTTSVVDSTLPLTWNMSIEMKTLLYSVQVWDDDAITMGPDDNCVNGSESSQAGIIFNMPAQNKYGNTVQTGNNGALNISYTINKPVLIFNDTSQVTVFGYPPVLVPVISPNDSVCGGDSVKLSVDTGYSYQWYADTTLIIGANDSVYYAKDNGTYKVEITNTKGCKSMSQPKTLTFFPYPPKPFFVKTGINQLQTFLSGYLLQWYYNGQPVPNANSDIYMITQTGYYKLSASNEIGCTIFSDSANHIYTPPPPPAGVEHADMLGESFFVYPNPTTGKVAVSSNSGSIFSIEILNVLGKQVYNSEYSKSAMHRVSTIEIDLSGQPEGIYFLRIQASDFMVNKKVVLQLHK